MRSHLLIRGSICPDLVYYVEKPHPFISSPYLIWSRHWISLKDFDVTFGHLRKITGHLLDIDHIR